MNAAAAPGHDWPGIRIQVMDIIQPPAISMPPIDDIEVDETIVSAALAIQTTGSALMRRETLPARKVGEPWAQLDSRPGTRRGASTRLRTRCGPSARDRATDTCPTGRRARAHRWSRCDRRRRLQDERAHARPVARVRGSRSRHRPRTATGPSASALRHRLRRSTAPRSCIRCRPHVAAPR